MTKSIEDRTRAAVSEVLPDAIRKTLESYRRFIGSEAAHDTKQFSAHHTACKVAIAHLELLLKLARWADIEKTKASESSDLAGLLHEASEELHTYQERAKAGED